MNYATFTKKEGFDNFYSNICNLLDDLDIDRGLNSLGVDANKVSEIALKASNDAAASTNPRQATIPQLETLISDSLVNAR